jgi:TetR/AcrR family tetracycline transcriptional repressor
LPSLNHCSWNGTELARLSALLEKAHAGSGAVAAISEADRAEMQRRNRVQLALLPPDRYPRVIEAAAPLTACDDRDLHYRFGVDLFIAGVEAIARTAGGLHHPASPA